MLSVDGLSATDLGALSQQVEWLNQFTNPIRLKTSNGQAIVSLQSVWAEILTGRPWYAVGCPGYRRPTASLNECEVVTEDGLWTNNCLINSEPARPALLINMPLLKPRPEHRLWLADGSLPLQTTVSPSTLAIKPPFNSYRPRPFSSSARALLHLNDSVKACLEVEQKRIQCAIALMESHDWQSCFLRITVFDLLTHLLGPGYLLCEQLSLWPSIKTFLQFLDTSLKRISQLAADSYMYLISTFSHIVCRARLNPNQLLAQGGYCNFAPQEVANQDMTRRKRASLVVAGKKTEIHWAAQSLISLTSRFEASRTAAASPVYGTVYLNLQDRFKDGIVSQRHALPLMVEVAEYLKYALELEFGNGDYIFRPLRPCLDEPSLKLGQENATLSIAPGIPDLIISIDGVELTDSSQTPIIDYENHPHSVHKYEGFVCLPESDRLQSCEISNLQLHQLLKERFQ